MSIGINVGKFKVYQQEELARVNANANADSSERKQQDAATPTDGGRLMTDTMARMGRAICVGDFIRLLRGLNPSLIFEISKGDPSKYGIYVERPAWTGAYSEPVITKQFIVGMESGLSLGGRINEGVMPEFSIIENSDVIVPDGDTIKKVKKFEREIRGWRTVLAALHIEGLLTEAQIERTFKISEGQDSLNWQRRVKPRITIA